MFVCVCVCVCVGGGVRVAESTYMCVYVRVCTHTRACMCMRQCSMSAMCLWDLLFFLFCFFVFAIRPDGILTSDRNKPSLSQGANMLYGSRIIMHLNLSCCYVCG